MKEIAIVGMGNMGSAVADLLQNDYQITGIGRNDSLSQAQTADAIILAVKPQVFLPNETGHGLADELWPHIGKQRIISIMAGVTTGEMCRLLGTKHVVRTMPNLANNLIAWYAEDQSVDDQALEQFFGHWDINIRLESEKQFDAFTAIAGSGLAYFFRLARAMEQDEAIRRSKS